VSGTTATLPRDLASTLDEQDKIYRKVIFRIVPLFFLGFIVSYLDRVNISYAKLQMASDFGMTDATFALGASVFFWGYMLFEIPSNLVLQRFGARMWIARIMITWGIVSMLMVFSSNPTVFYTLRFLLGVCEAGFVPGVMYYTNCWLPAKRQSGMYSLFLMALPVSIVFGAPLSGAILDFMNGVGGLKGWHWLFVIEGIPSLILGFVIIALLRNKPRDVAWLTDHEKDIIEANVKSESAHKLSGIGEMLKCGKIYLLIITMILFNTGFYGLTFWMPTLLKNAGVTTALHNGLFTAIPFGLAAIAMRLNARHSEKTGEQRLHGTISVLLASVGLFLATYFHENFGFSLAMLSVAAAGILSLMPIYWTLPGRILSGSAAAAGLALINSCGSLSGILGSLVIGFAGMQVGMYTLATMLFACSVLFYLICPSSKTGKPGSN
jgi:MFS family permease